MTPGAVVRTWDGVELGVVVGFEADRDGQPKRMLVLEPGAETPRVVPLRFVRGVTQDGVLLAGPRDGYHIAPAWPRRMDERL